MDIKMTKTDLQLELDPFLRLGILNRELNY